MNRIICCISWENFPEWLQAFGTVIAAVGLIIAFIQQRKTLKEQRIITSLERARFLNNYLPILELNDVSYQKFTKSRILSFSIIIRENYLQKLEITDNFPNSFKLEKPYIISDIILPKEFRMDFKLSFKLPEVIVEIEEYTGNTILFDFEDALGNKYRQMLIYKGSSNLFLHPALRNKDYTQ